MSLITRCPSCQTLFKVVPDQLRISEGWVRCGQCDEIFDASLHLVPFSAPVSVAAVPQDAQTFQEEVQPLPAASMASTPEVDVVTHRPGLVDEWPIAYESAVSAFEVQQPLLSKPDVETSEAPELVQRVQQEPQEQMLVPAQAAPLPHKASREPEDESQPGPNEISFLRQANVPAAKPRRLMRTTWVLLSVTLVLGLAGQIAMHERDQIAALRPDLKPLLQAICDRLNCRISPWRKIESIVIDSSSFTRIHDDSYRLSLTLKNMLAVPVALPALELTLTDTLDQPVIRRVLMLSEIDSDSESIASGSERPVSLTMTVNPPGGADRIAGYRLIVFYP